MPWSKKSALAQLFTVHKSAFLLRFLLMSHSLAGIASLTNALPWMYQAASLTIVAASLFISLRYHGQCQPYGIRYDEKSGWSVAMANDNFQAVEILPSSVITSWLIVLHSREGNGKTHHFFIPKDALGDKDFRALGVSLKIAGLKQQKV